MLSLDVTQHKVLLGEKKTAKEILKVYAQVTYAHHFVAKCPSEVSYSVLEKIERFVILLYSK